MKGRSWVIMVGVLTMVVPVMADETWLDLNKNGTKDPYEDPALPVDKRADDLVSRMTLPEKISQIRSASAAVPRLGIPGYQWWTECLHGVTSLFTPRTATCFPQSTVLAASWDPELVRAVADCISDEARARHHVWHANGLTTFSPNINILRDPRWGRGLETYGEDPLLTARIGTAFIRGLQGDDPKYTKFAACAKHYCAHSGPETKRRSFNATVSLRDLYETYTPAFESAVRDGSVAMVMTAYNAVNGMPCTANEFLIQNVLRTQFGFSGLVISDDQSASDVCSNHRKAKSQKEGGAMVLNAGCDLELGQAAFAPLARAVGDGLTSEARVSEACRRAMAVRFRLGMFDPPALVGYSKIPISVVGGEKSRATALRAAREGVVLLKNDKAVLPLDAGKVKRLAVIGPNADCEQTFISTYFWDRPTASVTPLTGIRKVLEGKAEVRYVRGCDWEKAEKGAVLVPSMALLPVVKQANRQGLEGEYFAGPDLGGKPVLSRLDQDINFNWDGAAPHASLDRGRFSARWRGRISVPKTGTYTFIVNADDGARMSLGGDRIIDDWKAGPAREMTSKPVSLEEGKDYTVVLEYFQNGGQSRLALKWRTPASVSEIDRAAQVAAECDATVLFLGTLSRQSHSSMEGEWIDRGGISLPDIQEQLLRAVVKAATGKPVVLVQMSGGPLSCPWAVENVPAVLQAGFPGQEGGTALAEVLFGGANPGGKLPYMVYRSEGDVPPFDNYSMEGRTYRFFKGTPLYPFGHGLSYTAFKYGELAVVKAFTDKTAEAVMDVSVNVANAGTRDGDEVVQLYLKALAPAARAPQKTLVAFQRVSLKAGENKAVPLSVRRSQFRLFADDGKAVVEPGQYELQVGSSSADIRAKATVTLE